MSERFDVLPTSLVGLHILRSKLLADKRGYLERLFCMDELRPFIDGKHIEQINRTLTLHRGAVRGLHFQHPPHAEIKFVNCLRGEVFDVAVDLRRGSPTFLQWHAEILSADNHKTMKIPEGFAHGFQTLSDNCEMLYFHTTAYLQAAEGGLRADDPRLSIRWPLPVAGVSPRDAAHPLLKDSFAGVET
jgi:dTDP-4-dehydrorhamnose 3,5-epimerase